MAKQLSTIEMRHLQRIARQDPYFGHARLAAAVTHCKIGDPFYNIGRMIPSVKKWKKLHVDVGQFGELSIPGYSAGRLLQQTTLLRASVDALIAFKAAIVKAKFKGVVVVGCPLIIDDALFNCTIAICQGKFLAVSVKRFPPNYEEFTEHKEFAYGRNLTSKTVRIGDQEVPCGTNLILD